MRAAGLLLAWALLRPAGTQQCHHAGPGGVLRFTDRHAEIRVPALHRVPSSLDPLYSLVRRCLDLIQQNPLPTGEPGSPDPTAMDAGTTGVSPTAVPVSGAAPGFLSCFTERDAASVPAPLPGDAWGCIGWDLFHQRRGFFCRAAQGSPERPRLGADVAGEPGRGAGDPVGMAPTRAPRAPQKLGASVLTTLFPHVGGAV